MNYLGFNLSPSPQSGQGAFGTVAGNVGLPPSVYDEVASVVPNLPSLTSGASDVISSNLKGELSPSTMMNIGNYAAARGVSLGMPNSPMSNLVGMNITGQTTEQLQNQGIVNYLNFLTGVAGTQLSPELTSNIAQWNAVMNAAPDPTQAANYQKSLFDQYMNMMKGPAGGTGAYGGFGAPLGSGFGGIYSDFNLENNWLNMNANNPFSSGIGKAMTVGGGFEGYSDYGIESGGAYDFGINPEWSTLWNA